MSEDGAIARQDEVLELLYWLEGEGFQGEATLAGMARFLTYPAGEVAETLRRLIDRGDVVASDGPAGPPAYGLTHVGRREAARRFAEEFEPFLHQGHGECNDPDCDCHTNAAGAAECHARVQGGA